jgi:hypothetical protein
MGHAIGRLIDSYTRVLWTYPTLRSMCSYARANFPDEFGSNNTEFIPSSIENMMARCASTHIKELEDVMLLLYDFVYKTYPA